MSLSPDERLARFQALGTDKYDNDVDSKVKAIFAPLHSIEPRPSEAELKQVIIKKWEESLENVRK